MVAWVCALLPAQSRGNDRLPVRYRTAYESGIAEAKKYQRYILRKVWAGRLHKLRAEGLDPKALAARAEEVVDEAVHILLPQTRKIAEDVLYGTGHTHLRLTFPERHKLAVGALKATTGAKPKNVGEAVQQAIDQVGGTYERELTDRIEQALVEDAEDFVQREVEGALGLPVVGRPRHLPRPLPPKWEERYAKARSDVHTFDYWWLRKKRRMQLTRMATAMRPDEIDAARHDGRIWGLVSAASQETWAQNRLRIDFAWGHLNWEIDRRRIRRRMDQDLAQGAWALAKLVKEVSAPETNEAIRKHLDQRVREELSKPPLRERAEQFPTTARALEKALSGLSREIDPILNRAMDRAQLPDLQGALKELAREHGRRYAHEELGGELMRIIQRRAAPMAAAKRVRDRIPGLVASSLNRFDPGRAGERADVVRRKALEHVHQEIDPVVDEEIESALREGGRDHELLGRSSRAKAIGDVRREFEIDRQIEKQVRQTLEGRR
jgi:hypothetical protein